MPRISGYASSSCACSLLVALVVMATTVRCCSEPSGGYVAPDPAKAVADSDLVVLGYTREVTPDAQMSRDGSHVYTAVMEVRCIFKGEPVDEMITIRHVGQVPGLCISTNLTVGVKNIVFLRRNGDAWEPQYEQWGGDQGYLDELLVVCDVKVQYPLGRSVTNFLEMCPEKEEDYDDPEFCAVPETITEPPMPPTPEAEPNAPDAPDAPIDTEKSPEDSGLNQPDDGTAYNVKDNKDTNSASTMIMSLSAVLCLFFAVFVL